MSTSFYKIEGAGNDFIFLNEDEFEDPIPDKSKLVEQLCHRHFGIGADGVVFTKNWKDEDEPITFDWDFYNDDGSAAEMCGNAARCAVVYNLTVNGSGECEFNTAMGKVYGTFEEDEPIVQWNLKDLEIKKQTVAANGKSFDGYYLNTGVPHFVIPMDNIEDLDEVTCALIQQDPSFGEAQTNVTPLQMGTPAITRSFERGVRQFTLACGTGAIAAAKVIHKLQGQDHSQLEVPGGTLEVKLQNATVSLKGPAFCVFKGVIDF